MIALIRSGVDSEGVLIGRKRGVDIGSDVADVGYFDDIARAGGVHANDNRIVFRRTATAIHCCISADVLIGEFAALSFVTIGAITCAADTSSPIEAIDVDAAALFAQSAGIFRRARAHTVIT